MKETDLTIEQLNLLGANRGFEDKNGVLVLYRDDIFVHALYKLDALDSLKEMQIEFLEEDTSLETYLSENCPEVYREHETWLLCKNPNNLIGRMAVPINKSFGRETLLKVRKIIIHDTSDEKYQGERFTLYLESTLKKCFQYSVRASEVPHLLYFN